MEGMIRSGNGLSSGSRLETEMFESFADLEMLRDEWDNFVERVGGEIFLTYDWLKIWWKYYGKGRNLKVYVFRSSQKIVGVMPLFLERVRLGIISLKCLKIVGSDFVLSQFCLPIEQDHLRSVICELRRLLKGVNFDIFHLGPIAGIYEDNDLVEDAMSEAFGNSYKIVNDSKYDQTYFTVPDDWDCYLRNITRNERANIKRTYNLLDKQKRSESIDLVFKHAGTADFEDTFANFVAMHQSRWKKIGMAGHFGDWPDSVEFHREIAREQMKRDRLRLMICFLKKKGEKVPLGYIYSYKFGNRYLDFLDARSENADLQGISFGRVSFCEHMKTAIDEGMHYIDHMRGKYEYKIRRGGRLLKIKNIYAIPRRKVTLIRVSVFRSIASIFDWLYYRGWYCTIACKLKLTNRRLSRLWIKTHTIC